MVFELANIKTSLKDKLSPEIDTLNDILRQSEQLRPFLGDCILCSDGEIKKGTNFNLITLNGHFNVSRSDTPRIYFGDGNNFFDSQTYFFNDAKLYLGFCRVSMPFGKITKQVSSFSEYNKPMYNLLGLYRKNRIKDTSGFLSKKPNVDGKIKFLEEFLWMPDKSKCLPKDSIVSNKRLRLKLLENHYRRNVPEYALSRISDYLLGGKIR